MGFIEIEYRERETAWAMSELQSHDYYELYFLLSGEREFFYENEMFNIGIGAFAVIPPFTMHKTSGGSYSRVNVNISPGNLTKREREYLDGLSKHGVLSIDEAHRAPIFSLLRDGASVDIIDAQEKQSLQLSFVHTILYLLERGSTTPLSCDASTKGDSRDTHILKIVSYLNKNYSEELSLEKISESFYISKNTLCARFREAMQCSVMQYLAFVRLSRAKELLTTSDKSIEEISELCGYSSANYFSLIFKRSVGMSPKNYKKTK